MGTPVELGIWKDIFKAKSALNNHDKKKKSLIINYSNGHSFLKHFKDVYIETRCLLHRQPPISVDLTALPRAVATADLPALGIRSHWVTVE